ncbi:hypothetical protein DL765_002712 [Monosporascus sp. GIB2]|nr:hypothetical protein DL765_002712 [Monosporascus sp. GIB2]
MTLWGPSKHNQALQGLLEGYEGQQPNNSNSYARNNRGGNSGNVNRGTPRGGHSRGRSNYQNRSSHPGYQNCAPVHDNPNPRYKGRNFDPEYHLKKNFTAQNHQAQYQHPHPFPLNSPKGNQQGDIRPQSDVASGFVASDTVGNANMCDGPFDGPQSSQNAHLEKRYADLEANIKFFCEILAREEGEEKIRTYLECWAGHRTRSVSASTFQAEAEATCVRRRTVQKGARLQTPIQVATIHAMDYTFVSYGPSGEPPVEPPKKGTPGPKKGARNSGKSCDKCYKDHRVCTGGRPCDRCKASNWECVTIRDSLKRGPIAGAGTAAERILGSLMRVEPGFEQYVIGLLRNRRAPDSEHSLLHMLRTSSAAKQKAFRNAFTESRLFEQVCLPRQIADSPRAQQTGSLGGAHNTPSAGSLVDYPQMPTSADGVPTAQQYPITPNAVYTAVQDGEQSGEQGQEMTAASQAPIAQQYTDSTFNGNYTPLTYGEQLPIMASADDIPNSLQYDATNVAYNPSDDGEQDQEIEAMDDTAITQHCGTLNAMYSPLSHSQQPPTMPSADHIQNTQQYAIGSDVAHYSVQDVEQHQEAAAVCHTSTQQYDPFNAIHSPLLNGEQLQVMVPTFELSIAQPYNNSSIYDYGLTYPVHGEDPESILFPGL